MRDVVQFLVELVLAITGTLAVGSLVVGGIAVGIGCALFGCSWWWRGRRRAQCGGNGAGARQRGPAGHAARRRALRRGGAG